MKIIYLISATNLQELKTIYFSMAKKYHPDTATGNLATMKIINNEYDYLKFKLKNTAEKAKGEFKTYTETAASMESFKNIIEELLRHPKITIEIIGSWLWISGQGTFSIKKDILMEIFHCKYSGAQKKFYWFAGIADEQQSKPRGGYLKKAIEKYGIETLQSKPSIVLG